MDSSQQNGDRVAEPVQRELREQSCWDGKALQPIRGGIEVISFFFFLQEENRGGGELTQ